jgi:hypothetical protein
MPEWPGGVISHTAGSTPNGSWIVVDVWEAQEAFDRFPASRPWTAFDPVAVGSIPDSIPNIGSIAWVGGTRHDPDLGRPIAAPLERCAELLGVDLVTVRELAAKVEPYLRADGTRIWSLMQLERQLRPEAYGRRRGGYLDRRRIPATDA